MKDTFWCLQRQRFGVVFLDRESDSAVQTDLNAEFYKFSKDIADADVGLRLLITFEVNDT